MLLLDIEASHQCCSINIIIPNQEMRAESLAQVGHLVLVELGLESSRVHDQNLHRLLQPSLPW